MAISKELLTVVIPCYNEATNIVPFHKQLQASLQSEVQTIDYELLYIDDGSTDQTLERLHSLANSDKHIRIISLSRNFGKEIATSAGIQYARGDATLLIDGDGQHPAELIPQFIHKWRAGAQVVVGIRKDSKHLGIFKRARSRLFYSLFNHMTGAHIIPGSTDFRLIDKVVRQEFLRMTEHNRLTRGLIDWLGFKHDYIYFSANNRLTGKATYSLPKLVKLATDSFISLSLKPLYLSIYTGLFILPLSLCLGLFSVTEMLIGDPLGLHVRGTAFLVMLVLFLVGILLLSQGITALYLSHVHTEALNRPLFVVNEAHSRGLN